MQHESKVAEGVVIRAKITEDEWRIIRIEALRRDTAAGDYVAELLRAGQRAMKEGEE